MGPGWTQYLVRMPDDVFTAELRRQIVQIIALFLLIVYGWRQEKYKYKASLRNSKVRLRSTRISDQRSDQGGGRAYLINRRINVTIFHKTLDRITMKKSE
jgi:hypothetical protein